MDTDYIPVPTTIAINSFKAKIPNDSSELRNFVRILSQSQYRSILDALGSNDHNIFASAVTYIQSCYQTICSSIINASEKAFMLKFHFSKEFITPSRENIYSPIHIPKYNLRHVANSCHMNACISMLSSLTELVQEMNNIVYTNVELLESSDQSQENVLKRNSLTQLKLVCQMILNSYSELDFNNILLERTANTLNINIYTAEESNETMKSIMRILYNCGIPTSSILYWDTAHEFLSKEYSSKPFTEQIALVNPRYLLVNIHDVNTVSNNDTIRVHDLEYTIGENHYVLTSILIHYPGHFVAAFRTKNNVFRIIDDLSNRYSTRTCTLTELLNSTFEHVIGSYLRV